MPKFPVRTNMEWSRDHGWYARCACVACKKMEWMPLPVDLPPPVDDKRQDTPMEPPDLAHGWTWYPFEEGLMPMCPDCRATVGSTPGR